MNIKVLKELLKNEYHIREQAKNVDLNDEFTLKATQTIIDANGQIENIPEEYHPAIEKVINPLYTEAIESKTKWRNRMIDLAKHVSNWSRDNNAKVGAVLVSKKAEILLWAIMDSPLELKMTIDTMRKSSNLILSSMPKLMPL